MCSNSCYMLVNSRQDVADRWRSNTQLNVMYLIQRSYQCEDSEEDEDEDDLHFKHFTYDSFLRDSGSVVKTSAVSGKNTQIICISGNQRETRQHVIHFVFVAASSYCFCRGCQSCRGSFSMLQDAFMHILLHAVGLKSFTTTAVCLWSDHPGQLLIPSVNRHQNLNSLNQKGSLNSTNNSDI